MISYFSFQWFKGALTNDFIVLGGGGLEQMTQDNGGGGIRAKDYVTFYMISGKNFKQLDFKNLVLS